MRSVKILCIEDNETNISLMRRLATRNDHNLVSYRSAERALENFAVDQPHLIVIDYMLAGHITGLDLVKILRQQGHALPIVMASAYSDKKTECLEAGCDVFIEKPIDIYRFFAILDSYTQ